jgi:hypothetical protein
MRRPKKCKLCGILIIRERFKRQHDFDSAKFCKEEHMKKYYMLTHRDCVHCEKPKKKERMIYDRTSRTTTRITNPVT